MRRHLWFSLIASLCVLGAMGQTTDGSAARRETVVEENLHYLTVIKGRPDPAMTLADQMSRLHVPGVSIAVIRDKRIDWSKGYGVARLGGPSVSASTLLGAASMSKPVTAVAVLRLVQEGKIDLDADVNTYLKSWKIPANEYMKNHPVTVRELLSHTSGIGTHNGAIYDPDKGVPSMLEMLDGKPPAKTPPVRVESEPRKKYAYANGGYLILELLITDVTGKRFAQAMKELVLAPIGMSQSTYEAPLAPAKAATAATAYDESGTSGIAAAHFGCSSRRIVDDSDRLCKVCDRAAEGVHGRISPCAQSEDGADDGDGRHGAIGEYPMGSRRARRRNPAQYLLRAWRVCGFSMRHGWVSLGGWSGRAHQWWWGRPAHRRDYPERCASLRVAGFSAG